MFAILIVAECNVNLRIKLEMSPILRVLIVVNCNINILQNALLIKSVRYFNYRIILKLIILLEI